MRVHTHAWEYSLLFLRKTLVQIKTFIRTYSDPPCIATRIGWRQKMGDNVNKVYDYSRLILAPITEINFPTRKILAFTEKLICQNAGKSNLIFG